jgi:hypothetical protein
MGTALRSTSHSGGERPLDSKLAFCYICPFKMARAPVQLELRRRSWGGRRPGAGRKPSGHRGGVPHRIRPAHHAHHPLHVTLRARDGLPSLRAESVFPALRRSLGQASRGGLRLLQFSVQRDHVHLIVEAADRRALSRGLQGLAIRPPRRPIVSSAGAAGCGQIATMPERFGRRGRSGTRWCTCCRTGGSISPAREGSIGGHRVPGSTAGRGRFAGCWGVRRWSSRERGSWR